MARRIFRTAVIGMMAVAGLFLLFFVLKMLLFFLIVGWIVQLMMRRWHGRRAQMYAASEGHWSGIREGRYGFSEAGFATAASPITEIYR